MGSAPNTPKPPADAQPRKAEIISSAATFVAATHALSPAPPASVLTLPKRCPACGSRYPKEFRVCPQDATLLEDTLDNDPLIGAVLSGNYQVIRLVGEGGMGRVYEARHVRLANKRFAIKLLLDEFAHQPELLARFEREAQSAATIDHPNVVQVVDVCRLDDGRPFIVTEFLEGEELGALLDRLGKLPPNTSITIARQICRALMAAHAQGIVHRDMKPENVFLVGTLDSPRIKIIDFGISKQSDASAKLTRTGMVMGTPAYMAPEQARGEHVDHRADVYGVGGILYRCVTGHKPYEGEDGALVLTQVLTEVPKRPSLVDSSVPGELEVVIERAMAREAADRLPSMEVFEEELAALDHSPDADAYPARSVESPAMTQLSPTVSSVPNRPASKTEHAMRTQRQARSARPMIVVTTLTGYAWCAGLLVVGIADAIRFSRSSLIRVPGLPADAPTLTLFGRLTPSESALIAAGVLATTLTPLVLWIRHLARRIWPNTASSVTFAARMRASLFSGIVTYGMLTLGLAIIESLILRQQPGTLNTMWGVTIVVAALAVTLVTWWLSARRKP